MSSLAYKLVILTLKITHKKPTIYGTQNYISDKPAIFMCNHEKTYGPIITTTRFPIDTRQLANSMMTETDVCKKHMIDIWK